MSEILKSFGRNETVGTLDVRPTSEHVDRHPLDRSTLPRLEWVMHPKLSAATPSETVLVGHICLMAEGLKSVAILLCFSLELEKRLRNTLDSHPLFALCIWLVFARGRISPTPEHDAWFGRLESVLFSVGMQTGEYL